MRLSSTSASPEATPARAGSLTAPVCPERSTLARSSNPTSTTIELVYLAQSPLGVWWGRSTDVDETRAMAADDYCYLTTTGRRSGQPHRIEIWYALEDQTLYLLAGGGRSSDWVRNLEVDPAVTLEIGADELATRARVVDDGDEAELARTLLFEKYQPRSGSDLSDWRQRALPVALNLPDRPSTTP